MSRPYIPTIQAEYATWQNGLVSAVNTNAADWNIDAAKVAEMNAKNSEYNTLYEPLKNKKTCTPQQISAHSIYKRTYTQFLRDLVQNFLIPNPAISEDELIAMGLNPHNAQRSARPAILQYPTIALSNVKNGKIRIRCTTPGVDSKARHEHSNGIEISYYISSIGGPVPGPLNPGPPKEQGDNANPNPQPINSAVVKTHFSPAASFVFDLGLDSVGKTLHVYGRWINTSDNEKSGPYSAITSIIIS